MLSSVFKEGKNQQYDIIKTKLKKKMIINFQESKHKWINWENN